MTDCPHKNLYQDQLLCEWHCDDCGQSFGDEPPKPPSPDTLEEER